MDTLLALASKNALMLGSTSMNLSGDHFKAQFCNLMKSTSKRAELSSNGKSLVDGMGADRVLAILEKAFIQN